MRNLKFILIIFLFAIFSGCSFFGEENNEETINNSNENSEINQIEWKPYTIKPLNITFKYPSNWGDISLYTKIHMNVNFTNKKDSNKFVSFDNKYSRYDIYAPLDKVDIENCPPLLPYQDIEIPKILDCKENNKSLLYTIGPQWSYGDYMGNFKKVYRLSVNNSEFSYLYIEYSDIRIRELFDKRLQEKCQHKSKENREYVCENGEDIFKIFDEIEMDFLKKINLRTFENEDINMSIEVFENIINSVES